MSSDADEKRRPALPRELALAVLDALFEGVAVADADGRMIYTNAVADRYAVVETPDVPPEHWAERYGVYHPDGNRDFPTEDYPLVRALRGEETDDVELLIRNPRHPAGALISASGRPITDEDGAIIGAVATFRDVTALRTTQRQLRHSLAELEEAHEAKEEFTEFLVHDMKSPLTSILAGLELTLTSDGLPPADRATLEDVAQAAKTLRRMVLDLLDVQAADDGQLQVDREPVNLERLVRDVMGSVTGRVSAEQLHIAFSTDGDSPTALADEGLLRRVVHNLMDNCIEYGPRNGNIWLKVMDGGEGMIRIEVRDEGPGVPQDQRGSIFEKYVRGEPKRFRRDPGGLGLGLRLCKLAVDAQDGRIWVEDNEPVGARFCVELPVA